MKMRTCFLAQVGCQFPLPAAKCAYFPLHLILKLCGRGALSVSIKRYTHVRWV